MKATKPSEVRTLLNKLNIRPFKRLGQHFLVDGNILDIILDTARLTRDDEILEVGTGLGVLTEPMAQIARRVVTVEKDHRLCAWLKSQFDQFHNVELICGDILTLDYETMLKSGLNKVISNLPYSTGSAILVNFLKAENPPSQMVITLQLEVANRLTAAPSQTDFGLLSLWSQLTYEIHIRKIVSPNCFYPSPSVKSAIIHLIQRDTSAVELINRSFFFELTKFSFSHRRKQLKTLFNYAPKELNLSMRQKAECFKEAGIDPRMRPGALSVTQWSKLANAIYRGVTC